MSAPADLAKLREAQILRYRSLVRAVVRRIAPALPSHVPQEDLEGYGTVGLIEALDRYDPTQGVRFETFAWYRIRGAIFDHLRSLDLARRADRQLARQIERAHEQLVAALGREPSLEELAGAVGLPEEVLHLELGRLHDLMVASFEDLLHRALAGRTEIPSPDAGPEEVLERTELLETLRAGLAALPARERLVLGLFYYEGLTLAEIGSLLDLTESRVCQIQSAALLRLRTFLVQRGFLG
jgi:RNA polymerase sigma factor for flagellar operon FliA